VERLQKVLAQAGVASRRACEELIRQGRVQVNGQVVTELGTKVDPNLDEISVDGAPISGPVKKVYLILNKPPGYISTVHDPWGRPTVLDLIPHQGRLYPVGRLDAESEGLLLLTNDGELTHLLTHPRYEHEKEYLVLVKGHPTDAVLSQLRRGVDLEEGRTAPAKVSRTSQKEGLETPPGTTWLRIVIHEGRKRQIRRMCAAVGHPVQRLIRVRMGPIKLGNLPIGGHRPLSAKEVRRLRLPDKAEQALTKPSTIAIDGPAAAGKSTIAGLLAEHLGYTYLDTGVMYRAVTWVALERGLDIADEETITALARKIKIDVTRPTVEDGRQYTVHADGTDVTWQIRRPEVDANVSPVSAYPGVRAALTTQQRRIGQKGAIVMVGRDIGTVVLPDADLKIYLDASVEERARRRYLEVRQRGQPAEYEKILGAMRRRDKIDSEREAAPLRPADDAIIVDTDGLSIEKVLAKVKEWVQARDG